MDSTAPEASIRTRVQLPMRFPDGYRTSGEVITFNGLVDGREHLAIRLGPDRTALGGVPLVRPHSECLTGDVFGSERCDCGHQFREAVERVPTGVHLTPENGRYLDAKARRHARIARAG